MNQQTKLEVVVSALSAKKGERIIGYEFKQISPFVDYVVIASAGNLRQVHALANHVAYCLKEAGYDISHIEGDGESKWVLVDAKEVVVHVFLDEERDIYQLEKLYCDVPMISDVL